jgi:hypothetical protein
MPLIEYVEDVNKLTYYDLDSFNNLYIYAIENNMKIEEFFPIPKQRDDKGDIEKGILPLVY